MVGDSPHFVGASGATETESPASDAASPRSLPDAGSQAFAAPFDPDAVAPEAVPGLVEVAARGPLSAAQADAVARLVVQGRPLNLIAMAVGRSPEAIRRMMSGQSLRTKIDEVRALVLRETSAHWYEMLAMLPQARANMQLALLSTDESVRVSMSKWLHERIVPAPTQQQEVEHTVHFGEEVTQLLTAMNDRFAVIDAAQEGRDPLARVRTGPEALRRPVTVLPSTAVRESSGDDDAA